MAKPLFENVGGEMKEVAEATARNIQVTFGLISIVCIVVGISLLSQGIEIGWIGFLIAVGVFIHGYNKSRMEAMQLYAYGELVERVMRIEHRLSGKQSPKPGKAGKVMSVPTGTPVVPAVLRKSAESWVCPFCDYHNPAGTENCGSCGIAADYE